MLGLVLVLILALWSSVGFGNSLGSGVILEKVFVLVLVLAGVVLC